MAISIFGGDILSGILSVIAQSLLVPVMLLLVIFVIFSVIEIGILLSEYTGRRKLSANDTNILIRNVATCETQEQMCQVINHSNLTKLDKEILCNIANLDTSIYNKETREVLARDLLEDQEFRVSRALEKSEIVAKVGSACGLLGTIIPMGPGLAALGAGDMITLTTNLTTAFNTTTAGLAASSICYVVVKIRKRWYEEEIATLYDLAEVIVEVA